MCGRIGTGGHEAPAITTHRCVAGPYCTEPSAVSQGHIGEGVLIRLSAAGRAGVHDHARGLIHLVVVGAGSGWGRSWVGL